MSEENPTEITQEEESGTPTKQRALGFVNWKMALKNKGELRSTKGYALFDLEKYPITKPDAILLAAAKKAGGRAEIPVTLVVVVNSDPETAEEFDLDNLPE